MSGGLAIISSSSVSAGGDTSDSKRPLSGSAGLAASGSVKRLKSYSDCDSLFAEYAYARLIDEDFLLYPSMIHGRVRVERLLSKATELEFGDQLIEQLKKLRDYFTDLFDSVTELEPKLPEGDDEVNLERIRLVDLAKQILLDWEAIENAIPKPDHHSSSSSVSCLSMAGPVDYPPVVPSAWVFEYFWRDKAYEEVLSMRKKYSYLLDEAYRLSYTSCLKDKGVGGVPLVLSRKKLLNFVAISREDLDHMYVERCLKRVMSIKQLSFQMDQPCQRASGDLTDETQLPNWRDEIYEQVAAYRKMYSLELDELLRDEVDKIHASGAATPDEVSRQTFLEESLQFLANYRCGITLLSEEYCRKQLDGIKRFVEVSLPPKQQCVYHVPAATPPQSCDQTSDADCLINWRDLEYEQLQNKGHRFMYLVYNVYLKNKAGWSKMPACNEDLKKLEYHLERAMEFYKMKRGKMSVLFKTKEDYYEECRGKLKEDLDGCIGLIQRLLCCLEDGGIKPSWDERRMPFMLIPNRAKFHHRLYGIRLY